MVNMGIAQSYYRARHQAFQWRLHLALGQQIALAVAMAAITGLLAQVRIYLPWTAVPITGQTFAVLLAGVLLGGRLGSLSQILYIALGVAGIPWFSGWSGGTAAFLGPTGGYMLGFCVAALLIGTVVDRSVKARGFLPLCGLMLLANGLIYTLGLARLAMWLGATQNTIPSLMSLLWMGAIPFVVGDLLKIAAAAAAAKALTPKERFDE